VYKSLVRVLVSLLQAAAAFSVSVGELVH
jgi:hypothetical protein